MILVLQVLDVGGTAEIAANNLAGSLRLKGFNATMTWSKLGDLQANYIQVKLCFLVDIDYT